MDYRFLKKISDISCQQWNAVTGTDYPFLRHEFLIALELSACVSAEYGWQPQHLIIEQKQEIIALVPLYLKQHSYGEFVFDHIWADAYHRNGLDYYPKLVNAIPFTPCNGPRIAIKNASEEELIPFVATVLQQETTRLHASSWHCLFPDDSQLDFWLQTGAQQRLACHFHWFNNNYECFEDFLSECQSRKRKEMRRERKKVQEAGIRFERLYGTQINATHIKQFYLFYILTNAKYNGHGGYLNEDFFQRLLKTMPEQMLLVLAYKNEHCIAGALNFFSTDTLYGRYWGCSEEHEFLHFETCLYQGIDFCIEHKLNSFDPGAQGEHKIKRGFKPITTNSFHYLAHPQFREAVQSYLTQEKQAVLDYQQSRMALLPFMQIE
jgi:predicted N-acyltransferase